MKRGRALFLSATALCGSILAGCDLAPDYQVPATSAPETYKEAGDWVQATPADDQPCGPWWEIFRNPELNQLEDKVTEANQNLKIAVAQYDEARAAASAAHAAYFPTVTGNLSATRQKLSSTLANNSGVKVYNDFSMGADFSYEVDIWGRVRNSVAAANEQAEASADDLAGVALSLHAELATDYFALRGDDAMQDALDKTVATDEKALKLVQDRLTGGIATDTDLSQAETQFDTVRTQAADMRLQRAQLEHAIAVLTGQAPASFKLFEIPLGEKTPVPMVKPGLPSTLLERRPDIAGAERRTASANAEIGVARAAYFPTFSLTGMLGFESSSAADWLIAPSRFWSLGPQAALTIFDAGRISALSDQARAAYDEAAANYRQTVLTAYQDVEDNLVAMRQLSEEDKSQRNAVTASRRALAQENDLYRGGAATYLDVSVAQNTALQAELNAITIRVRRMTASVQLIEALGGRWQAPAQN